MTAAESWRQQQAGGWRTAWSGWTSRPAGSAGRAGGRARGRLGPARPGPGHAAERRAPRSRPALLLSGGGQAGQTELLAGAIRRHLPGQAARHRARAYLRRRPRRLVPQQIGRARADLQYRLAEATRQLAAATAARYTDGTSRLERALGAATGSWGATAGEATRRDRELASGQQALDHVLTLLGNVAVTMEGSSEACRS